MSERESELARTVSLCSCSSGCFWITSVPGKERSGGQAEKGSERRGSGAHSTNQGSYFGRGPGPRSGVLWDRAVIVSRLKWVKPGLNSVAGPPRYRTPYYHILTTQRQQPNPALSAARACGWHAAGITLLWVPTLAPLSELILLHLCLAGERWH